MHKHLLFLILIPICAANASLAQPDSTGNFMKVVEERLASEEQGSQSRKVVAERFAFVCPVDGSVTLRHVLREYGAIFAAGPTVKIPERCMFRSEDEVQQFQAKLKTRADIVSGTPIELQEAAMSALLQAVTEANAMGLRITPLDGSIAGRRNFADTVRIWNSRFLPALTHYVWTGGIPMTEAEAVRWWEFEKQAEKVLEWESRGYYFGTGRRGPIFASTAPPGTSQHLSLLAFDVVQYGSPGVRKVLNKHGWFQTVVNDGPHFTFLGLSESELPNRGLKAVSRGRYTYWVPNLGSPPAPPQK
jgi:hypothetical protein